MYVFYDDLVFKPHPYLRHHTQARFGGFSIITGPFAKAEYEICTPDGYITGANDLEGVVGFMNKYIKEHVK